MKIKFSSGKFIITETPPSEREEHYAMTEFIEEMLQGKKMRTPIQIIEELQSRPVVATYNIQVNQADIAAIQREAFDDGYQQGRNAAWNEPKACDPTDTTRD